MFINNKFAFCLIFLLLLSIQILRGQNNIAIIDFEHIENQIPEKKILLEGKELLIENFKEIFPICVNKIKRQYKLLESFDGNREQLNKFYAELVFKEYKIYEFEELLDSFASVFDKMGHEFLKNRIKYNLEDHFKINKLGIPQILDSEGILYCNQEVEFTETIIKEMTDERSIVLSKNETLLFMLPLIEEMTNKAKLKSINCIGAIPEEIDIEEFKKKIESKFLLKGVKKKYKYLIN